MTRIADISTAEAAKLALDTWGGIKRGMIQSHYGTAREYPLRLLYHSLTGNEITADAMMMLVGIVDSLANEPTSVALTEYLLTLANPEWPSDPIQFARMERLARLGIVSHFSGSEHPPFDHCYDPSQFNFDNQRLDDLIKQAQGPSESLRSVFEAVRTLIGLRAGLIRHKTLGSSVPIDEINYPNRFEKTEEYRTFLRAERVTLSMTIADYTNQEAAKQASTQHIANRQAADLRSETALSRPCAG